MNRALFRSKPLMTALSLTAASTLSAALPTVLAAGTTETAAVAKPISMPAAAPESAPESEQLQRRDGAADFDFLLGNWRIHNRRLRERLVGSTDWLEFPARSSERRILGGLGVEEEYRSEFWPGFVGMAFRLYNPETRLWSIYWADSKRGVMEAPVVGAFDGDRGVFEGQDQFNGQPIRVRFIWSRIHSGAPRWEQAFSRDNGASWETNWLMDFEREPDTATFGTGWGDLTTLAWLR